MDRQSAATGGMAELRVVACGADQHVAKTVTRLGLLVVLTVLQPRR